jgi:glycine betaine/proline transport system substrate-binding protein
MDPLTTTDPERIDEYTLEGRLGAGGYGVVYAATDAEGRRVALKVLRPELADNPNLKERLSREGKALGRVGGDRNVEIYKVVTEGTHTYLVMELVLGETLQERVERDGPLGGPILWFTAQGLIEALQAIHDAGITHRDLKPSNVMFGPDGVKVLDFGISAIADETGLTQTGAFLGTAAWISPEQILGHEVTEKCDVFNLGLVVAYAATGRHAYGEGRPDAVMYRISNLDADLEGINEPLVAAIRRCLERDPALRPSMSELLVFFTSGGQESLPDLPPDSTIIVQPGQIDRVVKRARQQADSSADPPNSPPRDPPTVPPPPPPSGPNRRWGPRILALAALIVIGGAVGFFVSQNPSSDETSSPATASPSPTTTPLALTEPDNSVQAPDASVDPGATPAATTAAPTTTSYSVATTAAQAVSYWSDPIKLPIHNWSSQIAGVYAVGAILEATGNSVEYISADSTHVYTSMCQGDIDLVHEVWEGAFGVAFMEQVDAGCVIDAATHDAKTREDWWYPSYVEDVCPGLPDWEALNDCASLFATPDSGGKGRFLGGPVDWLKGDQERVEGLEMDFIVENAGTAGALWAALDAASVNQEPVVIFNWTPNFIEAMYDGKFIEFPAFDDRCRTVASWGVNPYSTHDCGNPKDGYLKLGVWSGFPAKWPNAYAAVQKMNFTNLDIAQLAMYVDIDGMEPVDAAYKWLADNCARWTQWANADSWPCSSPDDSYLLPEIEIECHNGDGEGNYEWLEQYFNGTWDWDESTEFDSITLDYGDGKSYTSWTSEDAVENAFWHRYDSPGRFTVRATIADSSGQTATDSCVWEWTLATNSEESLGDGYLGEVVVRPGEFIQIRSVNAISGDVAFLGVPNQRGVELAIRDYGPINGHQVSMGSGLNDYCSADGGLAAAQMIVADEDVVGVIGTSCSGAATAASPLISEAGMVMISGSNTSPALTSDLAGTAGPNYNPGYYRTAHNDLYQGVAAASFAIDVLGVSTAAAIHDGDPYTHGLAQAFADAFEARGGTITGFTAVNKGDTYMVPVLTAIAAGAPEMLFFPIFQPEGDFIIQQASQVAGLDNTTMMAADGLLNRNYMALEETEGMYFSGPDIRYGSNRNEATGQTADGFLAAYYREWGEDPAAPFWAHSYDATTLLLDAIAAASYDAGGTLVIDRAGVREFLNSVTDYSGIIGLITCDAFGDCGSQKITVIGHGDSGDVAASWANVVYEYAPSGSKQVGAVLAAALD